MKKISTLVLMTFFCCLSAMAQVELGDIQFSLGEGKKINPNTGKITVKFPNVTGVSLTDEFTIEGVFDDDMNEFDGMSGTFDEGVTIDLADAPLTPARDYVLTITKVFVNGNNLAPSDGYKLNFKTRGGGERKLSYAFQTDDEVAAKIAELIGESENDANEYWKIGTKGRVQSLVKFNDEEVTLDGNYVVPFLEDIYIKTAKADGMLLGQNASSSYNRLHLAGKGNTVTLPDCNIGDKLAIKFGYVDTKAEYSIQIPNATSESATNDAKDSVQAPKNPDTYVFEVHTAGDLTMIVNNSVILSIDITPASDEIYHYSVEARDSEGNLLKTLASNVEAKAGDLTSVPYPYWLATAEGKLVTYGTSGSPFSFIGTVKSDTTFVLTYKDANITNDVVYLSEAEDIEGTTICESNNSVVRSSGTKAAYATEDTKIFTLEPGSYKFRAILFDRTGKTSPTEGVATFIVGDQEILLNSDSDNWTDAESGLAVVETATDVIWKAGGSNDRGLDVLVIYASTDAPDDPSGIENAKTATEKVATRKVVKDGKIVIETKNGTFNVAGVQQK